MGAYSITLLTAAVHKLPMGHLSGLVRLRRRRNLQRILMASTAAATTAVVTKAVAATTAVAVTVWVAVVASVATIAVATTAAALVYRRIGHPRRLTAPTRSREGTI